MLNNSCYITCTCTVYVHIVKMGTTYSSHYVGDTDGGLEVEDIQKIYSSKLYRELDRYDRQFFSRMIVQGDRYTHIMSRDEIVQDILYNIERYVTEGELVLAWFTDDSIYPDVGLLGGPIRRVILRDDQKYLLEDIDQSQLEELVYIHDE